MTTCNQYCSCVRPSKQSCQIEGDHDVHKCHDCLPPKQLYVYIATAEDTGSNDGEQTLGIFLKSEDAHKAVETFTPPGFDEEEPAKWILRQSFDQKHDSGAKHVTRYTLDGSKWWAAYVIMYEVR